MSEDQPSAPIRLQEQQITPDIPPDGQYDIVRTSGDVDAGWSLDHATYDPDTGRVVAFKPHYDERGQLLGNLEKQVNREEAISFNSPENKEARRQEQLQAELGEDAVRNEVDAPYPQRIEQLFSPVVKNEDKQPDANPYDALVDPNALFTGSIEGAAVRSSKERGSISDDSLETARNEYMAPLLQGGKDPQIAAIIKRHAKTETISPEEAMKLLREDGSLRKELGVYLLDKLAVHSHALPERVARNEQKSANWPGYESIPNMRSQEYVALLAIAKLDGTFNYEGYLQDSVQTDDSGNVILGQHMAAADFALN